MQLNKNSKIFLAGHRGLLGSAILRNLKKKGFKNIITVTSTKLDCFEINYYKYQPWEPINFKMSENGDTVLFLIFYL